MLTWLESEGYRVCIDFRDFRPGAPSITEMERAVEASKCTRLVPTPNNLASNGISFRTVMHQTLDPVNQELCLIPLLKEPRKIPTRLGILTYIDFADPHAPRFPW